VNNLDHKKIRLIYTIGFIFAGLLFLSALRWQVIEADKFAKDADARAQIEKIPSLRGTIYAADGSTLAYSEPRYNLFMYKTDLDTAEKSKLQTTQEFAEKIAPIIGMTSDEMQLKLRLGFAGRIKWFKLADGITREQGDKIKTLTIDKDKALKPELRRKLQGYALPFTARRVYPEGQLASQAIGLTDIVDNEKIFKTIGRGGLEYAWDGFLEPRLGLTNGEVDARGVAVGFASQKTTEAIRGSSVVTTIDKRVQKAVEEKLAWGVGEYKASAGSAMVIEPKTGRILAMANFPTFNLNERDKAKQEALGNKAVNEPYEFGSVGKVFTLAAGIDLKKVTPGTVVLPNGHSGCERISDELQPICTADKRPQGPMDLTNAFRKSDNLYFYHLSVDFMPKADFWKYLHAFGIGRGTNIELDNGGDIGSLKEAKTWNIADQAAYSYGHSYQITMVQAASAVGALANYGVRMQPQIVSKVIEEDGKEKPYTPIALEQVVSRETAVTMDSVMHEVYLGNLNGDYRRADLKNYYIAMKSGTALIPRRQQIPGTDQFRIVYTSDFNATYVGYDASPSRTFLLIVRLEAPQVGDLSSDSARPLWMETFNAIKGILNVPRKGTF